MNFYGEKKWFDAEFDNKAVSGPAGGFSSLATAANATPLALITVGDGQTERDGRYITVTDVILRCQASRAGGVTAVGTLPASNYMRVLLVLDRQWSGGADPGVNRFNESGKFPNGLFLRDLQRDNRFEVLDSFEYTFRPQMAVTGGTGSPVYHYPEDSVYFTLRTKKRFSVLYSASSGDDSDVVNNALRVVSVAGKSGEITLLHGVRVRFFDG